MVQVENLSESKVRYYSDSGMKIRQIETGRLYDEAVHILPCRYTYEETDIESEYKPNYKVLLAVVTGEEEEDGDEGSDGE